MEEPAENQSFFAGFFAQFFGISSALSLSKMFSMHDLASLTHIINVRKKNFFSDAREFGEEECRDHESFASVFFWT